jgi:hypothetical protein
MIISNRRRGAMRGLRAALFATSLMAAAPALAQLSTATIRGQVTNSTAVAPGTTVTAVSVETGATARAVAGANGSYILTGLSPGSYDITFTPAGGTAVTRRVIVSVGETASLDVDLAAPEAGVQEASTPPERGAIVVTGRRLVETRTSEVGTNVSTTQIENLPQGNRNFIDLAALAPGMRILKSGYPLQLRQTFGGSGVGLDPNGDSFGGPQVNVFIDGVSLRSNVNQGGIVGQDVSQGNPFSQLAVREFRVLTSNFKAEYEDAGTSIISAITKSGTNQFHGEAFGLFQNQHMVAKDFFQKKDDRPKGKSKRFQYGAALGGPIIKDRLFFFVNYEANHQDRNVAVVPGVPQPGQQALMGFDPQEFAGTIVSPFREHLGFGKLTFLAADNNTVELSGSIRKEKDLRDFGGQNASDRGVHVRNDVYTAKLSDKLVGEGFLNEASVDFLKSNLEFGAPDTTSFGRIYQGVIAVGGRADFQQIEQQGLTFRDSLSLTNIRWNGEHLVKLGGKLSFQKYHVGGSGPFANPQFEFVFQPNPDPTLNLNFGTPANVRFGGGNPDVKAKTTQIGLFAQDDWRINEHLVVNAGLRWDVDTNAKNNRFVTPPAAVAALQALGNDPRIQPAFFDVDDYISNGHRKTDWNNFAPRIGFSYDINADQRTVLFGGYGRYYDRTLFRSAAEETLLSQYRQGELLFSTTGLPRNGRPTILFNPNYLTPEGFAALLAGLAADPTSPGTSELRVIPNNLKTPYTDQFSIGVRQRFGIFRTSLTLNHTIGKDQIGYAPLNRSAAPGASGFYDFIPLLSPYSNAIAAFNTRATKYDAVFLTVDKPYSKDTGWGGGIAYTGVLRSKERGFTFNFDYPNIGAQPYVPNAGNEKHRLVVNGIADLPLDFRLSGLLTYGSGAPFFVTDANRAPAPQGFMPGTIRLGYFNHLPHFLQVDLRLQKIFHLGGDREFGVSAEVFNLFNRANFGGANGFKWWGNPSGLGDPTCFSGPPG